MIFMIIGNDYEGSHCLSLTEIIEQATDCLQVCTVYHQIGLSSKKPTPLKLAPILVLQIVIKHSSNNPPLLMLNERTKIAMIIILKSY